MVVEVMEVVLAVVLVGMVMVLEVMVQCSSGCYWSSSKSGDSGDGGRVCGDGCGSGIYSRRIGGV